ncbi:MAG TPA: cell division protein FtsZ [Candidatus Methanoperedenaceae archaeon]|nr:cell division protein FtsZ [Candidatus Methanoperedenaceae archaeon]
MLNVLLIGAGQCGNRILDAVNKESFGGGKLSKYYSWQKFPTRVETIAVNTAVNDLKELKYTKAKDRIHIPYLHGVGANRNVGKQCFIDNKDYVMRAVAERGDFDVAFIATSTAGGTGSSFTPLLVSALKERYSFPIYVFAVLPFREEGTIYLQNTAFCLKELRESGAEGIILVDNQFLRHLGSDIETAYDRINEAIAERILFLFKSLDSEMMMVTDLGDFKTVMTSGIRLATVGFSRGDKEISVKSAIRNSLSSSGLLFSLDAYTESSRAMIIIEADKKYLNIDDITTEVDRLTTGAGHVFKGILVRNKAYPSVLSVLAITSGKELDNLYDAAVDAVERERRKKEDAARQVESMMGKIGKLEAQY